MNSLSIFFLITVLSLSRSTEKIRYISTGHPAVSYANPKYVTFINMTSRRHGRSDPFYYVGLNFVLIGTLGNNVSVDFYFYELLTNRYKRGFVEMHFKLCDLIENDQFFGFTMRQGNFAKPCPFGPGEYRLSNMSIPIKQIPHNFPFTKGRIYCNVSGTASKERIGEAYIDMEIKETRIRKRN